MTYSLVSTSAEGWTPLLQAAGSTASRWLSETTSDGSNSTDYDDSHADDGHSEFGVHIAYEDLYEAIIFLACIYVAGQIASRLLQMPALVGEIIVGILLGPPLADFVPYAEAWVLIGEIGLVLLVLEAGIDIDVTTLKLIGTRGMLIAIVGSVLPIGIGIALAFAMSESKDAIEAIAAGATFGPTSLGIALNILRSGGVLNTPVGQLIISAAVIDDMIALIILSQLKSLTGTITAAAILIPVISAVLFLVLGGYIALYWVPPFMSRFILSKTDPQHHGKIELAVMFGLLLAMMPATYYAKASYLMGAFVSGLAFCTSHELHALFVRQFKRIMQWLMRIFFAASIGFQVPVKDFGNGTVIWQGLVFTIALLGKLAVGFMVPNFTQSKKFTQFHLRDCLITGFSMAAEGEFAFVIAVFSVDSGLISQDIYASVVLAVLLSTIFPPFALRYTISYYNKKAQQQLEQLAQSEMDKNYDLEVKGDHATALKEDIKNQRAVFFCIQTQSNSSWGLLPKIMAKLTNLGIDIIDHRSWHPRGINTTLVNEIYCKDHIEVAKGEGQAALDARMKEIEESLAEVINQPETSNIKVSRWYPGVVEEITEKVDEKQNVKSTSSLNVEERLLQEASARLTKKQTLQTSATKEKTVEEILAGMEQSSTMLNAPVMETVEEGRVSSVTSPAKAPTQQRARRRRQKMRSTPVVGGGLFGETTPEEKEDTDHEIIKQGLSGAKSKKQWKPDFSMATPGTKAELIVNGESFAIRINDDTLRSLRSGFGGDMLDSRGFSVSGVSIQPDTSNVVDMLGGYVRNQAPLGSIQEENEGESETSSMQDGSHANTAEHARPPAT